MAAIYIYILQIQQRFTKMAISQFNFGGIQDFTELEINSEYQLSDEMFGFL